MRAARAVRVGRLALWLVLGAGLAGAAAPARGEGEQPTSVWQRDRLLPDWRGALSALEARDVLLEISYTGDYLANVRGGLARKGEYLGNLDVTLTWHTETLLGRDLGTLFLYGLWDHGGKPSDNVGDIQAVDNIEAPDSAKLFEAWWQKSLFANRGSLLVGLYDVNSEFYAIESAELFVHSSFGMGGELGTTGINGPSIFPTAGLGARFKLQPVRGFEMLLAVTEGVPGDPRRPKGTRIDFDDDEGAFVIAEVAHVRSAERAEDEREADAARPARRRRVGRAWAERPRYARFALGAWMYTAKQPHVSRTDASGDPIEARGHPGLYLTVDYDADHLDRLGTKGLMVFLQLGWADGDVGPFAGYVGGGFKYDGLLPSRPHDESGFAVAAAFAGDALRDAAKDAGDEPGRAEIALEWTYRAAITPWLSLQGDLQYVVNPAGLRSRPDAVVAGLRWVIDL